MYFPELTGAVMTARTEMKAVTELELKNIRQLEDPMATINETNFRNQHLQSENN
jgi:hypothetical protein